MRRRVLRWVAAAATIVVVWWAAPFGSPTSADPTEPSPQPVGAESDQWQLLFADEFGGENLDGDLWVTCYWWDKGGCTNLGNHELQWYLPDQVSLGEGSLVLTAQPGPVIGWEGAEFPYKSGMVTTGRPTSDLATDPRFSFQYGYVEIRAQVPGGQGLWSALWMLPTTHDSKPEVDILEVLGDRPDEFLAHVHWRTQDDEDQNSGQRWTGPDLSQGFHVYGLAWSETSLVWFVDGVERWRYDDPAGVPNEPMYLLANLAVGGDYPGPPDSSTPFPAEFRLDYVRVWQAGNPS